MTTVTVVVCTRDRPELLARSLPTVLAAGAPVIVVEQGDSGAERYAPDVQVLTDDGRGASRARNVGLEAATTDLVLFTDDDCAVAPGWAAAHLAAFDADDDPVMTLGPVAGLSRGADVPGHLRRARPWLLGHSANMGVRRSEAVRLGGFDTRLGAGAWARGGEDADLVTRMLATGRTVRPDVGPPTTHLDWRDVGQARDVARGYERGAGAWLGRALRRRDPAARRYAAARAAHLAISTKDAVRRGQALAAAADLAEFAAGLAYGLVAPR